MGISKLDNAAVKAEMNCHKKTHTYPGVQTLEKSDLPKALEVLELNDSSAC